MADTRKVPKLFPRLRAVEYEFSSIIAACEGYGCSWDTPECADEVRAEFNVMESALERLARLLDAATAGDGACCCVEIEEAGGSGLCVFCQSHAVLDDLGWTPKEASDGD